MSAISESTLKSAPLPVESYYRWQSKIYDATRWSFLFGRSLVLRRVAAMAQPARILEIGCGTGRNLAELARLFPQAELTGLDVSADMLAITRKKLEAASRRVTLLRQPYPSPVRSGGYDLILCSYALSMFNPGWEEAMIRAQSDLAPGGLFALVDFHDSRHAWFRRWMGLNHVRMEGHLVPKARHLFLPKVEETRRAYGGLWQWTLFLGEKFK